MLIICQETCLLARHILLLSPCNNNLLGIKMKLTIVLLLSLISLQCMAGNDYDYWAQQSLRDNYNIGQQELADAYARNQDRFQNGDY